MDHNNHHNANKNKCQNASLKEMSAIFTQSKRLSGAPAISVGSCISKVGRKSCERPGTIACDKKICLAEHPRATVKPFLVTTLQVGHSMVSCSVSCSIWGPLSSTYYFCFFSNSKVSPPLTFKIQPDQQIAFVRNHVIMFGRIWLFWARLLFGENV